MRAFRGTAGPEARPAKREYPVVYFTKTMKVAVEYAAGDQSPDPGRGWGYVQEYEISDQLLLSRGTKKALELATEYIGREPYESEMVDLFWDPDLAWIRLLKDRGYTGFSNGGAEFFTIDAPQAELLNRWRVEVKGREFVAERVA